MSFKNFKALTMVYHLIKPSAFVLCLFLFTFSCQKNEIEELQRKLAELENRIAKGDSIIYSDITVNSQEELELFRTKYITHILGDLRISNCTDLTPLSSLKLVQSLEISVPQFLTSFNGLENLGSVDNLYLYFETGEFRDPSALDNIKTASSISLNGWVQYFDWFNGLDSVGHIDFSSNLPNPVIRGFEKLEHLSGLNLGSYGTNDNLKIEAFQNLTRLDYLRLYGSTIILEGFESLSYLGSFSAWGDEITINGLSNLLSLEHLSLSGYIINISSLNNLSMLKYLDLHAVTEINGLDNITNVQEQLSVNIPAGSTILQNLGSVGALHVYGYDQQTSPVRNLGDLNFKSLTSINALSLSSPHIETLGGFDFTNQSFNYLEIYDCPKLTSLDSLINVTSTIDWVAIVNSNLSTLNGLDNITGINYLYIYNNKELADWCAIKDIFDNIPINQRFIEDNLVNPKNSNDIIDCG